MTRKHPTEVQTSEGTHVSREYRRHAGHEAEPGRPLLRVPEEEERQCAAEALPGDGWLGIPREG